MHIYTFPRLINRKHFHYYCDKNMSDGVFEEKDKKMIEDITDFK